MGVFSAIVMNSTTAKDASLVSVATDESTTARARGRGRRCDDDTGMPVAYKVRLLHPTSCMYINVFLLFFFCLDECTDM